jgi:hypothetical protein
MAQSHEPSADRDFIRDVIPLLRDPRYIRVAGRPLLAVYRPESLADPKRAAATWREECRRAGIGEIHLVAVRSFSKDDPATLGLWIKRKLYLQEINILFSSPVDFLVTVIELYFFGYNNLLIFNYIARRVY